MRIEDREKLNYYIDKYNICDIFTEDVRENMELMLFQKNEFICKFQEEINYLYFFVSGKAKVYITLSNGKSLLLCFYTPFRLVGDVELFNEKLASGTIQVIEDSYCIAIPKKFLATTIFNDGKFLKCMCEGLGEKLTRLSNYSTINLLYPLENRVASYILFVTSSNSQSSEINFEGNLTQIAELLGASYRHLLRVLNKLISMGAIRKNIKSYEVINYKILKELAGDLYQ